MAIRNDMAFSYGRLSDTLPGILCSILCNSKKGLFSVAAAKEKYLGVQNAEKAIHIVAAVCVTQLYFNTGQCSR